MKKYLLLSTMLVAGLMLTIQSCKKQNNSEKDALYTEISDQKADLSIDGDYERVITKRLVRKDNCRYVVAGTIEYRKGDRVIAIIDFGDGRCDNLATKTVGDQTEVFELDASAQDEKYRKIIVEPIVKLDDCEYIVAGIIDFYEGDKWVATMDFGDGTCDEWATKTWDGGSKTFSMKK